MGISAGELRWERGELLSSIVEVRTHFAVWETVLQELEALAQSAIPLAIPERRLLEEKARKEMRPYQTM